MEANRRNFLGMMVGGVLGAAAVRAWPFRVYSFPSQIMLADWEWVHLVRASDIRRIENTMDVPLSAREFGLRFELMQRLLGPPMTYQVMV